MVCWAEMNSAASAVACWRMSSLTGRGMRCDRGGKLPAVNSDKLGKHWKARCTCIRCTCILYNTDEFTFFSMSYERYEFLSNYFKCKELSCCVKYREDSMDRRTFLDHDSLSIPPPTSMAFDSHRVFEEYQTYRDADTGEREMDWEGIVGEVVAFEDKGMLCFTIWFRGKNAVIAVPNWNFCLVVLYFQQVRTTKPSLTLSWPWRTKARHRPKETRRIRWTTFFRAMPPRMPWIAIRIRTVGPPKFLESQTPLCRDQKNAVRCLISANFDAAVISCYISMHFSLSKICNLPEASQAIQYFWKLLDIHHTGCVELSCWWIGWIWMHILKCFSKFFDHMKGCTLYI